MNTNRLLRLQTGGLQTQYQALQLALKRVEWLRTGRCYVRANVDALLEGLAAGHFSWSQINLRPVELLQIAERDIRKQCPVSEQGWRRHELEAQFQELGLEPENLHQRAWAVRSA